MNDCQDNRTIYPIGKEGHLKRRLQTPNVGMLKFRITRTNDRVTDLDAVPKLVDTFNQNLVQQLNAQRKAGEGDLLIRCGIDETVSCHRAVLAFSCDLPSKKLRSSQTREIVEIFVDMCYNATEIRLFPGQLPAILEIAEEFGLKSPLRSSLERSIGSHLEWFVLRPHLVQEIPESSILRLQLDQRWAQLLFLWWDGQNARTKTYISAMKRVRDTIEPTKKSKTAINLTNGNQHPAESSSFISHIPSKQSIKYRTLEQPVKRTHL